MQNCILIILIFSAIFSRVISVPCPRDGDVRMVNGGGGDGSDSDDDDDDNNDKNLIQVCFDSGNGLQWTYVCTNGWSNLVNGDIFCKRSGYLRVRNSNSEDGELDDDDSDSVKLTSVNCIGNETSLTQCSFSTRTNECDVVANIRCVDCEDDQDCRTTTSCTRIGSSSWRTCECINECMNNGYCFDETCVCQSGFTGPGCETNLTETPASTSEIPTITPLTTMSQSSIEPTISTPAQRSSSIKMNTDMPQSSIRSTISTQAQRNSSIQMDATIPQSSIGSTISQPAQRNSSNQMNTTIPQSSIGSAVFTPAQNNPSSFPTQKMNRNNISPPPDCGPNDCQTTTDIPVVNWDVVLIIAGFIIATVICVIIIIISMAVLIAVYCFCRKSKERKRKTVVYSNSRVNDAETARDPTTIRRASNGLRECYPEITQYTENMDIIYELATEESFRNYESPYTGNSHHYLNLPQISTDQSSIQTEVSDLPFDATQSTEDIEIIYEQATDEDLRNYESPYTGNEYHYLNLPHISTDQISIQTQVFEINSDGFADSYEVPNPVEDLNVTPTDMEENVLYSSMEDNENMDNIYHVITQSEEDVLRTTQQAETSIIESLKCDLYRSLSMDYVEPSFNLEELENSILQGSFEIPLEKLNILKTLASGNFGIVHRATFLNLYGNIPVAVKTLKTEANTDLKLSFIREAAILSQFNHPNVLRFIGVVTKTTPYMIVTELLKMELKNFLTQLKSTDLIQNEKAKIFNLLTRFCKEIATGMEYLAGKKFIHRDLAARNVLLAKDLTCRIADFGMSRSMRSTDYYTSNGGEIPLRWTSPEAIFYKKYSEKSDVWAYGVTMYEIWTLGERPWEKETHSQIMENIAQAKNLPKPINCTETLYQIMIETWKKDPKERPTFHQLKQRLNHESKNKGDYVTEEIDEVLDEGYVDMSGEP